MVVVSALDIRFLLRELRQIEGSLVDKVFQFGPKEVILQLHKAGEGKQLVKVIVGEGILLAKEKRVASKEERPTSFAMLLRKQLRQARILNVVQPGLERIIEVQFSNELKLIVEMFSKGNVVLCDRDNKIIALLQRQVWKDRTVKKGEPYKLPPSKKNVFMMDEKEFTTAYNKSGKDNVVKILATDFSLGGKFAEEVCTLAKLDKTKKRIDTSKIFKAIHKLENKQLQPAVLLDGDEIIGITPVELEGLKQAKKKQTKTLSEALELAFNQESKEVQENKSEKERLADLAEKQKQQIKDLEKKSVEYKKIGDAIYSHYNDIESIIKDIKENDWKTKNKLVKELNKKEKKVVIEL